MDKITKEQVLEYVAPCSLLCFSCPGFTGGVICKLSKELYNYFEGYYDFQVENLPDEYKSYAGKFKEFYENLGHHTTPRCSGCRNNPDPDCCIKGCFILECTREHNVDYCGECKVFPCNKADALFNPTVYGRWLRGNERIKEVGITQFFEEEKTKSHYIDFKKDHSC